MKRILSLLFASVILVNSLSGGALSLRRASAAPQAAQDEPAAYTIQLHSRNFAPNEGEVPAGLEAVRRKADGLQAQRQAAGQAAEQTFANGRIHALVQLYTIPDQAEVERLADQGIFLLEYIPENAWLAALELDRLPEMAENLAQARSSQAETAGSLRWAGALETADRLSPELLQAAGLSTGKAPSEADRLAGEVFLTVRFFRDQTPDREQRLLDLYGARVAQALPETHRYDIYLPAGQVARLAAEDALQWMSFGLTEKTTLNNDVRSRTGVEAVQAAPYSLSGAGVQLGIWDGGSVGSHIDFSGRLTVVDTDAVAARHATHVAGTMAGSGAGSTAFGLSSGYWRGMAPGATIFSYDWNYPVTEHNTAINSYSVDLSQNSWGYVVDSNNCHNYGDYASDAPEYDAVVTGLYGRKIPVLFAAGNDRDEARCGLSTTPPYLNYRVIIPPATAKNIITVGAANADDDTMTDFSSWGPTDDGRLKPEVIAPGCKKATYQNVTGIISPYYQDNDYYGSCGTSMATPAVSGIVALLIQQYRLTNAGADPLPSTLKAALIQTAVDMDDGTSYYNYGPDYASGYGRVDAKAAVDLIIAKKLLEDTVGNGQSDSYTVNVAAGTSELKISLAWDDKAAAENASKALVNNLNLSLKSPSGSTVLPLVLNPASPSATATNGVDAINNSEQVRVSSPEAGKWTITVSGASVPYGPQAYTLAGYAFSNNTPPNTPATPTPAQAAGGQAPALTLKWAGDDPDGHAITYDVYLGTTNPPTKLQCNDTATRACYTGTLNKGTIYYWKVIATDSQGAQTFGPVWRFTTTASGVPAVFNKKGPGNMAVGLLNPRLRWEASSEAGSYAYCYATSTAGCTNWTPTTQTSASLSGLLNSTNYYWQVRAIGANGTTYANNSTSAYWSFTTLGALPQGNLSKVTPASADGTIPLTPQLQWSSVAGATSYQYCLDTSDDDACVTWVSAGTDLNRTLSSPLDPFTTYYWQVRAVLPGGVVYYANDGAWWSFFTGMGKYRLNLPVGKK